MYCIYFCTRLTSTCYINTGGSKYVFNALVFEKFSKYVLVIIIWLFFAIVSTKVSGTKIDSSSLIASYNPLPLPPTISVASDGKIRLLTIKYYTSRTILLFVVVITTWQHHVNLHRLLSCRLLWLISLAVL